MESPVSLFSSPVVAEPACAGFRSVRLTLCRDELGVVYHNRLPLTEHGQFGVCGPFCKRNVARCGGQTHPSLP